jgi:flagellar export protein FliJ
MPFRFRAQSALDLRLREEDAAKRTLCSARQAVASAASAVAAAEAKLAEGLSRARNEQVHATNTMVSAWLRNWLAGQRREIAALQRALALRRDTERLAAGSLTDASRRVRTLVLLRERLWQEHTVEERRAEQRELNWLGSLRYVAARSADNRISRPQNADRGEEVQA